jgi:Zn-dependent alcohol dehydrogenase
MPAVQAAFSGKTNLCTAIRATQTGPDARRNVAVRFMSNLSLYGLSTFSNFTVLPDRG